MFKLESIEVLSGFRLHLRFEDGVSGIIDLSDLAGRGVFKAWNDSQIFEAVYIAEGGGLEWPGQLDLCGDALYLRLTGKTAEEIFPSLKSGTNLHGSIPRRSEKPKKNYTRV